MLLSGKENETQGVTVGETISQHNRIDSICSVFTNYNFF